MFKRLRRWHFDLAFFLGLAIFSWAYWYSKPRPVWTSHYPLKDNGARNNNFTLLGYSADSQSIYTTCETTETTKNWPIPQIQRWSTRTGELLEDYPVEFPEEDRFLLQLPRQHFGYSVSTSLCTDPRYLLVRYQQSTRKEHNYVRLYRIDGKPVGQGREVHRTDRVEYLTDPTGGDHHWITQFELNSKKTEIPISVIDLDTGKPVRPPRVYARGKLDAFPNVLAGRHLVFKMKPTDTTPMQFEVVDLHTGESQGFIPLANRFDDLNSLDSTHFALCSLFLVDSVMTRINFYQFDAVSRTIQPDLAQPLVGLVSDPSQLLYFRPAYLVGITRIETLHQQHKFIQTLLNWLAHIGFFRNTSTGSSYRIYDMTNGQLLRQVTGIPQESNPTPSPDWHSIVTMASFNDKFEPGLCLYRIPHYLWETTLSWMQWLSWLLVIPWPLRYFLPQPTPTPAPFPSPSPDVKADPPTA